MMRPIILDNNAALCSFGTATSGCSVALIVNYVHDFFTQGTSGSSGLIIPHSSPNAETDAVKPHTSDPSDKT
jgi:hypothetical protein